LTEPTTNALVEATSVAEDRGGDEISREGNTTATITSVSNSTTVPINTTDSTTITSTTSTPPCPITDPTQDPTSTHPSKSADDNLPPPVPVETAISAILQSLHTENKSLRDLVAQVREKMTSEVQPRKERAESTAKEAKERAHRISEAKSAAYMKKEIASRLAEINLLSTLSSQ
jgi:hypothetical protein